MMTPRPPFKDAAPLNPKDLGALIRAQESAIATKPQDYETRLAYSRLLYQAGEFPEAMDALETAKTLDPLAADFQAAQSAMSANTFGRAGGIALAMNQKIPGHEGAAIVLARLYQMQGDPVTRAQTIYEALTKSPASTVLRALAIGACEDCGDYENAIIAAGQLASLQPIFANVIGAMRVYILYGDNEAVLDSADQAYALSAGDKELTSEVDLLRGHALKTLGRRDDAIAAYRDCIANKSQNGTGWWSLADMKNYKFSDSDYAALQAIVDDAEVRPEQKSQALFALAKFHDINGRPARGMDTYIKANAIHPAPPFAPEPFAKAVSSIISSFDDRNLSKQAALSTVKVTPVFILGMPRSGSTLLEQILASHSDIEGTIELPSLPTVKRLLHADCRKRFGGSYLDNIAKLSHNDLEAAAKAYLKSSAFFRAENTPFFTDKLPYNFEHVGLIHKILPHAKIIDARRNPMDCGLSIFRQHFGKGASFSYDLGHIGAYYNGYLSLMDHWDAVMPGKIIRVQYEDMVNDTQSEIRRILSALGVEFQDSCLRFYENKRAVRTASSEQVRRPISNKSIGMWRQFETELRPLKEALGPKTLKRFEAVMTRGG